MADTPILPAHIEQTISAIAELHREHQRRATPTQKAVVHLTGLAGRPRFLGALTLVLAGWVGFNGLARLGGYAAPDPPPFVYLQGITGIVGVYVALLILITQRHENKLSEARDQLTLELAILTEQKSAKIIALLEEMRRDASVLPDREDVEAEQLAEAADPQAVLSALQATTEEARAAPPSP